jgi:hypothetical protein
MLPRQLVLELGSDDDGDDESDSDSEDGHAAISQAGSPTGQGAAGKEDEKAVSQYQSLGSSLPAALHRSAPHGSTLCPANQAVPVPAAAGSAHDPIHLSSSASEASSPGGSRNEASRNEYSGGGGEEASSPGASENEAHRSKADDGDRDGLQGAAGTADAQPAAPTPAKHRPPGLDVPGPGRLGGTQPTGTGKAPPLRGLVGLRERLQQLSMGSNAATTATMPAGGGGNT